MNSDAKNSIMTKLLQNPKTPLPTPLAPLGQNAKAVVQTVMQQSTLPPEWETWLSENPNLSKEFFKQLQNLGAGDTLAFRKSIDITAASSNSQASVTTQWSHDGKALRLAVSGNLQHGLAAFEKPMPLGAWGQASAKSAALAGVAEKLEFTFAHPKDLESALQNVPQNTVDLLQFTQNPILFPIENFFSKKNNSMMKNLSAVELSAELTGEVAAKIQLSVPDSTKNSLLLAAQAELGGSITANSRIEWGENQTPFFVYQESLRAELQSTTTAQLQAFKSINLNLNKSTNYHVTANMQNETRFPLPKDLNITKLPKETLLNHIQSAAQACTQTETLKFNVEKPMFNAQNDFYLEGKELTFTKSAKFSDAQPVHLSFSDLINAFTGERAPDQVVSYNKTQESKSTDIKILGQGIGLQQSTTFVDVIP